MSTQSKAADAPSPMSVHGKPSWIGLNSSDPKGARAFYASVLGWNIVDMPMQDGSSYPGIVLEDGPIGGIPPVPADESHWLVFITVDDVDARFKAALQHGGKSIAEPSETPGVGRMATIEDPFGARIAFIAYG